MYIFYYVNWLKELWLVMEAVWAHPESGSKRFFNQWKHENLEEDLNVKDLENDRFGIFYY